MYASMKSLNTKLEFAHNRDAWPRMNTKGGTPVIEPSLHWRRCSQYTLRVPSKGQNRLLEMNKSVVTTDVVTDLVTKKLDFGTLPVIDQVAFKQNRSKPELQLHFNEGGTVKSFTTKYYDDYTWLTGCKTLNKLFCFACLINGGDDGWSTDGVDNIKRFTEKAEKHQMSKRHITNMEIFQLIGKVRKLPGKEDANKSKQEAGQTHRAEVLSKIMDMITVLNKHGKIGQIFPKNEKNCLGESILKRDICDPSVYKQTFLCVNEKLVEAMENQLLTDIKKEISQTEFCSILIDKIPTKDSEYCVIVRYTHEGFIKERFVGLYNIVQIFDLAQIFNNVTRDVRKAVCHSYDGSHVLKPLRLSIKTIMPKLLFLPNQSHRLSTLLLQNLEGINECRTFIRQVTFVNNFFTLPKTTRYLERSGLSFPCESENLWRFHSKTIPTILTNQQRLLKIVNIIVLEPYLIDLDTINSAHFVQKTLHCPLFMMFCSLFTKIFVYTDHLANTIQKKLNENLPSCLQEVEQTIKNISNLKTVVCIKQCMDENKIRLKKDNISIEKTKIIRSCAGPIITQIVIQIKELFEDIKCLKFVELLDEKKFSLFKNKFPKPLFTEFMSFYQTLFDPNRLENELILIYSDPIKRLTPYQLYRYLYDNDLVGVYSETFRLLKLYLTYPLTPTQNGTASTLSKLKKFLNIPENKKSAMLYVESYPVNSPRYNEFKKIVTQQISGTIVG